MRSIEIRLSHIARYVVGALLIVGMSTANASDHVFRATNPTWKEECASCHVAYPPQLLPAQSWQAVMDGLDRHFGTDATVEPKVATEIRTFLRDNAGRAGKLTNGETPLRITETRWFVREHDEVPARIWESPAVKSAANCEACHTKAAQGDFSERSLRVPR